MAVFRTAIPDFQLANPLYTGARVSFYTVDDAGASTGSLATLYTSATGLITALNPQTLDADGKFSAPVYIDVPVIAEAEGANIGSHATGVIGVTPRNRGDFLLGTVYFSGDFIRDVATGDWYMAADNFTATTFAADFAAGKLQIFFQQDALLTGIFFDNAFLLKSHLDATKIALFDVSAISTGTSRTYSLPNASTTLVGTDVAQTLTNKTLTSAIIATSLLFNSGTVLNWNAGDITLTHAADTLTLAGGSLVLPNGGLQVGSGVITIGGNFTSSAAVSFTGAVTTAGALTTAGAFTTSGANALTLTTTGATNVTLPTTGTLVNSAVTTLSSLASVGTITTGVWQATKIGLAYGGTNADLTATGGTSQVLKQASAGAAITVGQLAASDLSNGTNGSGAVALITSPSFTTPTLGVATATSINKVAITAPASGSTLTIANGKTATVSNTLTFSGTDASSIAFGAGGTVAYVANNLSAFAATTSAQLAGVISDETGTGALVFANSPVLVTPNLGTPSAAVLTSATGLPVSTGISGLGTGIATFLATPSSANLAAAVTDETGSGALVFGTAPTIGTAIINTPTISGGTHTALTGLGIRSTGAAFDLTLASSEVLTAGRALSFVLGDAARTLTIGASAAVSGSNTGDQTISLTGNVTGSGTGSFATTIAAGAITSGMFNVAAITGLTTNNAPNTSNDYVWYYSAADGANRKITVGSLSSAGASGVTSFNGRTGSVSPTAGDYDAIAFSQTGLLVKGATSNGLTIKPNETLTAGRTLNLITGDADRTLTLGGNITTTGAFATSGAFGLTLTMTGTTNVTFPLTGTLATLAGTETLSGKTLTAPRIATGGFIADANGNEHIIFTTTASAVNEITFANAATGGSPAITATGGDSNIGISLTGKGTKGISIGNAFSEKEVTVTDGAGAVIDASLGNLFNWTAGADRTAGTTTNAISGQKMIIQFKASGAGRTLTLPTATTGDFAYGSDITALTQTASGKTDVIGCIYNSVVANRWAVVAYSKGY